MLPEDPVHISVYVVHVGISNELDRFTPELEVGTEVGSTEV